VSALVRRELSGIFDILNKLLADTVLSLGSLHNGNHSGRKGNLQNPVIGVSLSDFLGR